MDYNYKEAKKRIDAILNDKNEATTVDQIPNDKSFNDKNGYYGKVTSIFIDIRKSTKLFTNNRMTSVAKTIRCFTSEIIEILNEEETIREKGIRGDCVYAIYANKSKKDDFKIFNKALYINTFLKMLNKTLKQMNMKEINAGIGIATHEDLVVKAGCASINLYSKIWIGQGVTYASKLADMARGVKKKPILLTSEFYNSINELLGQNYKLTLGGIFTEYKEKPFGKIYGCDLYKEDFKKWIDGGMKS